MLQLSSLSFKLGSGALISAFTRPQWQEPVMGNANARDTFDRGRFSVRDLSIISYRRGQNGIGAHSKLKGLIPRSILTLTSLWPRRGPSRCSPRTPLPHFEQNFGDLAINSFCFSDRHLPHKLGQENCIEPGVRRHG